MPNYCFNYICVETKDQSVIDEILAKSINSDGNFDFGALIPMPAILSRVSVGNRLIDGETVSVWIEADGISRRLSPSETEEYAEVGCKSWYEWSIENWCTKWNALGTTIDTSEMEWGSIEIMFDTAYTPPYSIFKRLVEVFPNAHFEFRCRFEDDHHYPHEIAAIDIDTGIQDMKRLSHSMKRENLMCAQRMVS